jgi:hypothetical protein
MNQQQHVTNAHPAAHCGLLPCLVSTPQYSEIEAFQLLKILLKVYVYLIIESAITHAQLFLKIINIKP